MPIYLKTLFDKSYMKNKFRYLSIAILLVLALAGCREEDEAAVVESLDCSIRNKLTFSAPPEQERVTELKIYVAGKMYGQATILLTDDKGHSRLERIDGDIDLSMSSAWESNLFNIECIPDSQSQGKLKVFYKFESE
jgi:hypothetical protein